MENLEKLAFELRKDVVRFIHSAGCGHIGGDMSVMDILVTLYFKHLNVNPASPDDLDRDRFILSKGHCIESLYMVLAKRGFLDKEDIFRRYCRLGSPYIGHPNNKLPGIEVNSGSLGHGLSVGVGMALALRLDSRKSRVYVVMGDGELAEGSVWEAAMAASHFKLDNICAVIDRNRLQISGETEDVMSLEPLKERWDTFGWNVLECDGNSILALDQVVCMAKQYTGKPTVVIANTTKGYGSSLMENKAAWHHKVPSDSELKAILSEMDRRMGSII